MRLRYAREKNITPSTDSLRIYSPKSRFYMLLFEKIIPFLLFEKSIVDEVAFWLDRLSSGGFGEGLNDSVKMFNGLGRKRDRLTPGHTLDIRPSLGPTYT